MVSVSFDSTGDTRSSSLQIAAQEGRIITIISDAGRFGDSGLEIYGGAKAGAAGFSRGVARTLGRYNITANDGNVAAGKHIDVIGSFGAGNVLIFDASAETDGTYLIAGGEEDDTLIGGQAGNTFIGDLGQDTMTAGAGVDEFRYFLSGNASESTGSARDVINGFNGVTDIFDPRQNIAAGAHHLRGLLDRYGQDVARALAAYNAGAAAIDRGGWPVETAAYVPNVLGRYAAQGSPHAAAAAAP